MFDGDRVAQQLLGEALAVHDEEPVAERASEPVDERFRIDAPVRIAGEIAGRRQIL